MIRLFAGLVRSLEEGADWAVAFYQKSGYGLLPDAEKNRLLRTYWRIPERQVETSVVLADEKWAAA